MPAGVVAAVVMKKSGEWLGPDINAGYIKDRINAGVHNEISTPAKARNLGKAVVEGKGGSTGAPGLAGRIGASVAKELPNVSSVKTLPKLFLGSQPGGVQGGISQIGSMLGSLFKQSVDDTVSKLPTQVVDQMGKAFEGSNAARGAAQILGPVVNKATDHLIDSSIIGKGLKFFSDPMGYLKEKGKEFGLGGQDNSGPGGGGGQSDPRSSSGGGGTSSSW